MVRSATFKESIEYASPSSLPVDASKLISLSDSCIEPLATTADEVQKRQGHEAGVLSLLCTDEDEENFYENETCALCLGILTHDRCTKIKACGHEFHKNCIMEALNFDPRCPICRTTIGSGPQGSCPSGTMSISLDRHMVCPGFTPTVKAIVVTYNIPSGVQKMYHQNPGRTFRGTTRVAYLPHNREGLELLSRLKYAFLRGLTFNVGTSLTTGIRNVVVWSSIHHKTSLFGGMHGFPDPGYIYNCHDSLTALGVPTSINGTAHVRPGTLDGGQETLSYHAPLGSLSHGKHFSSCLEDSRGGIRPIASAVKPCCVPCFSPSSLEEKRHCRYAKSDATDSKALSIIQKGNQNESCPICQETIEVSIDNKKELEGIKIKKCGHQCHRSCFERSLFHLNFKCPTCRNDSGIVPWGRSPSGTMKVKVASGHRFSGIASQRKTEIQIKYIIPSGIQLPYHPNPGTKYEGLTHVHMLPNTAEGSMLLERLKVAWRHGLLFQVLTSNDSTKYSTSFTSPTIQLFSDPQTSALVTTLNNELTKLCVPFVHSS